MDANGSYTTTGTGAWELAHQFADAPSGLPHGATIALHSGAHASTRVYLQWSGQPDPDGDTEGLVLGPHAPAVIELFAPHPNGFGQARAVWVKVDSGEATLGVCDAWKGAA